MNALRSGNPFSALVLLTAHTSSNRQSVHYHSSDIDLLSDLNVSQGDKTDPSIRLAAGDIAPLLPYDSGSSQQHVRVMFNTRDR